MADTPEPGSSRMSTHDVDMSLGQVGISTFMADDKDEYNLNNENVDSENFVTTTQNSWRTLTLGRSDEENDADDIVLVRDGDDSIFSEQQQEQQQQQLCMEMTGRGEGMNQQMISEHGEKILFMYQDSITGEIEQPTESGVRISSSISSSENPDAMINVKKRKIDVEEFSDGSCQKSEPDVVKFVRQSVTTQLSDDKLRKCRKTKKSPKRKSDLADSGSVLNIRGNVGDELRQNFCRLMNKEGPLFVTCRQCILQVKRARVFPDTRDEIPNLLSHIQLHQEIEGEDGDEGESTENKMAEEKQGFSKKPIGIKRSSQYGNVVKKTKKKSSIKTTGAGGSSPSQRLNKPSGKNRNYSSSSSMKVSTTTTEVNDDSDAIIEMGELLVPESSASGAMALGSGNETYTCALCNLTMTSLQEFINHSVSVHIKSNFSVKVDQTTEGSSLSETDHDSLNDPAVSANENAGLVVDQSKRGDVTEKEGLNELHLKIEKILEEENPCLGVDGLEVCVLTNKPSTHSLTRKRGRKKCVRQSDLDQSHLADDDYVRGPFICIECGDGEHDCYRLREHMTSMHGDRARVFVCKTCDTTWSEKNFNLFLKHMSSYHPNDEIACYFCRLSFKSCMDIRYHQAQHRPPLNFCCPYCYHEFSWILESEFSNHVTKHLEEELPFECRECQEKFGDFVARREHQTAHAHDVDVLKFHDELRPFICTGCGKQFVNTGKTTGVRALRQHVCQSGVTLDPRFQCQVCKTLFPLGRSLRQHMREKHEHHMCHICAVICKSKANLDEHVGYEHFGGTFPCPVCEESFDTAQKMKQHKTREHGARNFICEFCGQGFAARLLLVRHLKKHDEFQGLVCHVCGDKFLLADRLETHFRKYHAHVVSDQEYETIILDNVQTTIASETIAIIHE